MKNIIIYFKCLWWNKVLSLAYILLILGFSSGDFLIGYFPCMIGGVLAGMCQLGRHTIRTYKRMMEVHHSGHEPVVDSWMYCDKVAVKWFEYETKIKTKT